MTELQGIAHTTTPKKKKRKWNMRELQGIAKSQGIESLVASGKFREPDRSADRGIPGNLRGRHFFCAFV